MQRHGIARRRSLQWSKKTIPFGLRSQLLSILACVLVGKGGVNAYRCHSLHAFQMSCGELEETQLNALAHLPSMPKISSQLQCNLCRSSNARLLFRSDKYPDGRSGDIYKCKECGLVFRFPVTTVQLRFE